MMISGNRSRYLLDKTDARFAKNSIDYCRLLPTKQDINVTFSKSMVPYLGCYFRQIVRQLQN